MLYGNLLPSGPLCNRERKREKKRESERENEREREIESEREKKREKKIEIEQKGMTFDHDFGYSFSILFPR